MKTRAKSMTTLLAALLLTGLPGIPLQAVVADTADPPTAAATAPLQPEPNAPSSSPLDSLLQGRNTDTAYPLMMSPDPRQLERETDEAQDTTDEPEADEVEVHEEHADDLFQQPLSRAFTAANRVAVPGPATIDLAQQATLSLPAGYAFIPEPASRALLRAMRNPLPDRLQGMIFPLDNSEWFAIMHYEDSGHIRDDETRNGQWTAGALLSVIREQHPDLQEMYWIASPQYNPERHQLHWSLATQNSEQPEGMAQGISYQTRTLGREGHISLNLVTNRALVQNLLPVAQTLLGTVHFKPGYTYDDFNAATDRMAAYGLTTLITGVGPTPGFSASVTGLFQKFWYLIPAGLILLAGGTVLLLYRFYRHRRTGTNPTPAQTEP
ncbi:MAG TPA: DUF2167 domain-containing protein [Thiolinea sp.]|nr:DUF2167 domain-containing protein [Thiolinea sp.]